MMDVSTFAGKIKQKYPQYNSLSDQDLTNKLLSKYPQYKDQVQTGGQTITSSLGLDNIPGVGGIANTLFPAMNALPQDVTDLQQRNAQAAQGAKGDIVKSSLAALQSGGNLLQTAAKPAMELASYMTPSSDVLKGSNLASKAGNLAIQGGLQGGLWASGQKEATPGSIAGQAATGAVVNPALAGAGNLLTEKLPRYLGWRAYGEAGLKLPEVLQAQQEYGTQDLKGVRDYILESSKKTFTKEQMVQQVLDLATQSEWVGTRGMLDETTIKSAGGGTRTLQSGVIKDIKTQAEKSTDAFDFYSRLKNMAYPTDYSPASNKLSNFMKSAAHNVREQIINGSDNPQTTRHAMDAYAAQTAINAAKNETNVNSIVSKVEKYIPLGESGLGVIGMIAAVPQLAAAAPYLIADAIASNKFVAPKLASGLLKTGQFMGQTGIGDILRRLGVGAAAGLQNQNQ